KRLSQFACHSHNHRPLSATNTKMAEVIALNSTGIRHCEKSEIPPTEKTQTPPTLVGWYFNFCLQRRASIFLTPPTLVGWSFNLSLLLPQPRRPKLKLHTT